MSIFPIKIRRGGGAWLGLLLLVATLGLAACSRPGGQPAGDRQEQHEYAQALAYSKCMRSHGVPNYPDPTRTNGGVQSGVGPNSGIDTNSPQFQAASQACQKLEPGPGNASPGQVAQLKRNGLKLARCMRSHGIAGFPDPDSQGVIIIKQGSGVDTNSSQYQSALSVCQKQIQGGIAIGQQAPAGGS